MPVRETTDSQKTTAIVAGGLVLVAVAALAYQLWPARTGVSASSFYTVDNGQTYFRDSIYKFPPFDHDGKPAVRALVFRSSAGQFVGILQRYTLPTQKLLAAAMADADAGKTSRDEVERLMGSDRVRGGTEAALAGPTPKWGPVDAVSPRDVKSPDKSPVQFVEP